ncbi:trypsin-like peptidase domain-containing protein [Archangium violaceum]|uniref:trypsin-like serine peptidase n=1 Tax=Archangium violaceum TaxID=83451 RepID=UPI002B2A769C|nr:trypsin-like peptidase domain-containing protein [Archangium violaceum]
MSKQDHDAQTHVEPVTSPQEPASEQSISEYWTPQRKANALPRKACPDQPTPIAEETALRRKQRQEILNTGPVTSRVTSPNEAPFAAVGKLFFHWKGSDWVGSAWIINTPTRGIVTAAHNVFDENEWSSKVLFELQYADGHYVAEWAGKQSVALKGWTLDTNYAYDMAVVIPKTAIGGSVPALDYVVDAKAENFLALGYPTPPLPHYAFDGKYMWGSSGSLIAENRGVISAYNNLTRGSSGGPWCAKAGNVWVVNGIQSHGFNDPDVSYSPLFSSKTFVPLLRSAGLIS